MHEPGFATRAIHTAHGYTGDTGAVMPPVYLASTFAHGNADGFDYTRSGNPNFRLLADTIASLEGAAHACVFASGVSAITAIASSLASGDTILAEANVYGCTYRLFDQVFGKLGIAVRYADFTDPANWDLIAREQPRLLWLESPTNPLLKVLDLAAIGQRARAAGVDVVVDNTFASPALQRPLALGATLSLSSTTKYLNGHSDCLGGVVATDDAAWHERLVFAQKALGLQPSPFDAWLTARGIKTLALRMQRHCDNALALAEHLRRHPRVRRVRYPFLDDHPQHTLARTQMRGGSGIVTCELDAEQRASLACAERLRLFTLAESLGGVESLICHPASMTHASVPAEVRAAVGIGDGLLRLSVGIEDIDDLRADWDRALAAL